MTLARWKPNSVRANDEFDSIFRTIFETKKASLSPKYNSQWSPAIDLKETEKDFVIIADIAGVVKKDIQVKVVDQVLTIFGVRKAEVNKNNDYYHSKERYTGSFNRYFNLPDNINQDKISANFKNGVLIVKLEKDENNLPQEIEINIT